MAYGDAFGFLNENSKDNYSYLKPFNYAYDENINIEVERGQWSYITQLMLINCKCLVDNKEKRQVTVDYKRMIDEIKLWNYYRCGNPKNYIYKLKLGKKYYEDEFYWNDKRGEAFSRIFPIALANKNFNTAQEEVYKNIIYINRHPQVVLSGLLLLRAINFLLGNKMFEKNEIIDELKDYIIQLQLKDLEECINSQLPNNYKIKFEQEKINYLIDLDRAKNIDNYSDHILDSKNIFISSLIHFIKLYEDQGSNSMLFEFKEKEIQVITYGLISLSNKKYELDIAEIKDVNFIKNMEAYLFKLREYEVGKLGFLKNDNSIDLFNLDKGAILKHPLLNNIRIKDKKQYPSYVELIVESKSGEYKFIRVKK